MSTTERFPVFTEWNDVRLVFKWKVHLKLYVFYDQIFGKVEKNVYRKRQEWENIHPIVNRDYLPDRVVGSWSGRMVVPWLLLQGSYSPVVEKDVATSNSTTMFYVVYYTFAMNAKRRHWSILHERVAKETVGLALSGLLE